MAVPREDGLKSIFCSTVMGTTDVLRERSMPARDSSRLPVAAMSREIVRRTLIGHNLQDLEAQLFLASPTSEEDMQAIVKTQGSHQLWQIVLDLNQKEKDGLATAVDELISWDDDASDVTRCVSALIRRLFRGNPRLAHVVAVVAFSGSLAVKFATRGAGFVRHVVTHLQDELDTTVNDWLVNQGGLVSSFTLLYLEFAAASRLVFSITLFFLSFLVCWLCAKLPLACSTFDTLLLAV